ncbi:MAG: MoxR family ATPase [Phycisphaeraceae bacterium]|nr:MoxR family ATPase [Phycisphaeraceae bacterium]
MSQTTPPTDPAFAQDAYKRLKAEIHKVIVGQDDVVDQLLLALFSRGHALVVGVPGLAKTLLISTIARSLSLDFSRIQFTPDLMPSDITGTEVIEENRATGHRELRFVQGPVFANVVLADEINRTPPKTQAALLEAMQERQVTIGGVRHDLPRPFFVLATQNPIEQEGTYPLPEAQLDRFMFQIRIAYPSLEEETEIIRRSSDKGSVKLDAVLTAEDMERVSHMVAHHPVTDHVVAYALRLVRATRINEPMDNQAERPRLAREYLAWGAGPRASEYLVLAARAEALLKGHPITTIDHVKAVARPVLRHRILTNFNAEADRVSTDDIVNDLLEHIPVDGMNDRDRKQLDAVMRAS